MVSAGHLSCRRREYIAIAELGGCVIKDGSSVLIMSRLVFFALLLPTGLALYAQGFNPFDKASRERELARKRAELEREMSSQPGGLPSGSKNESVFDKASRDRASATQRAFDRGQKTALPAQEERESIGRMGPGSNAQRAEDGSAVKQGAPAAAVYNRVMETRRFFEHYRDPTLRNVNDSFTDSPADRAKYEQEALRIYPELLQPQSAFALRQAAIDRWIDSRQPPLARDARRKLLVAHMVSLELNGNLRGDKFGFGQRPILHSKGQRPPAFIIRNSFEVEVLGNEVTLPDGLRGKVIRGQNGKPDLIEWLDAEGIHSILIPQEASGQLRLFLHYDCDYRRQELQGGNYRVRFTKP